VAAYFYWNVHDCAREDVEFVAGHPVRAGGHTHVFCRSGTLQQAAEGAAGWYVEHLPR